MAGTQSCGMISMTAGRSGGRGLSSDGIGGDGLLWVGGVCDHNAVRASVVLRLLREPSRVASQSLTPVSLRVRYPDGPHDVETLIWTPDGRLLLVSKELFSGVVYQVPAAAVADALAGRPTTTP